MIFSNLLFQAEDYIDEILTFETSSLKYDSNSLSGIKIKVSLTQKLTVYY